MFEDLRDAFRQAVRNFKEELGRDEVPGAVDRLLVAMRTEVTEAQARLHELDAGLARTRAEVAREAADLDTCHRRERLALQIGDSETARLAGEYAARHERRKSVLEQKAHALEQEIEVRRSEVQEMLDGMRNAEKQRGTLSATASRTEARERVGESELFDELDRMVERMGGSPDREEEPRAAHDPYDDLGLEPEPEPTPVRRGPTQEELDARLAELKRRMGQA